ncbi:MAG: NADH-quinone oxidoreductase subunit J [Pseudomonadota bacterium]
MSELLANLVFGFFGLLTAGSAVLVVALRNLLHAAVALFFCLSGVAGLYILLGADFLGVVQLLIYAGGILVLIIFGVFLTARIYEGTRLEVSSRRLPVLAGLGIGAAVFALIALVIRKSHWAVGTPTYDPTTKELGNLFLTRYLLAFELISVLLLFALVGAAILVRKELESSK